MKKRLLCLLVAASPSLTPPAAGQSVLVDEGTFVVTVAGARAGTDDDDVEPLHAPSQRRFAPGHTHRTRRPYS